LLAFLACEANKPVRTVFDEYAVEYGQTLEKGISVSGEDQLFFAGARVRWLQKCLRNYDAEPGLVLDFGCGTGTATPFLLELQGAQLIGIDTSEKSLECARTSNNSERSQFLLASEYQPDGAVDIAFCNGVFHHTPPAERGTSLRFILDSLRPGGLFSFWENNPWNPGTRLVMSRIPFDRDAQTLSYLEAKQLLKIAGFQILRTDFLFIFPNSLRRLRPLETLVRRLPLGAQYQILCRKP
jgi:SAM-dependent methyltransferase